MPVTGRGKAQVPPSRMSKLISKLLDFVKRKFKPEPKLTRKLNATKAPDTNSHPNGHPRLNVQHPAALERGGAKPLSSLLLRSFSNQTVPPAPQLALQECTQGTSSGVQPAFSPLPPPALPNQKSKPAQAPFPIPSNHIQWAPLQSRNDIPVSISAMSIDTAATSGTPTGESEADSTVLDTPHHAARHGLRSSTGCSNSEMRRAFWEMRAEALVSYEPRGEVFAQPIEGWDHEVNELQLVPAPLRVVTAQQKRSRYAEHTSVNSPEQNEPVQEHQHTISKPGQKQKPKQRPKLNRPLPAPPTQSPSQPPSQPQTHSLETQRRKHGKHVPEHLPIADGSGGEHSMYLRRGKFANDAESISTGDFVLPDLDLGMGLREGFGREWAVFEGGL